MYPACTLLACCPSHNSQPKLVMWVPQSPKRDWGLQLLRQRGCKPQIRHAWRTCLAVTSAHPMPPPLCHGPLAAQVFILCNDNNIGELLAWASDPALSAGGFPPQNILSIGETDSRGLLADLAAFVQVRPGSGPYCRTVLMRARESRARAYRACPFWTAAGMRLLHQAHDHHQPWVMVSKRADSGLRRLAPHAPMHPCKAPAHAGQPASRCPPPSSRQTSINPHHKHAECTRPTART